VKLIKNILSSCCIALIGSTLEILHKKFGGFASGGRYADAHTLDELLGMSSSFLFTFVFIFLACFVYFQLGSRKKDKK
jgi:hypothetical protein